MQKEQLKKHGRYLGLLWIASIVLVSGCEGLGKLDKDNVPLVNIPKANGITPMTLTFVGETGNVGLSSRGQLKNAIKDFADNDDPPKIGQLISQMRMSNRNPNKDAPGFTGIGGAIGGHEFLDIALEALVADEYDQQGKRVVITAIEGQITDYKYDDGRFGHPGTGDLTVITAITSRVIPAGAGNPPAKTVGYKWKIKVNNNINGGFKVVERVDDPNNPFPGTMTFSPEMLNRINSLGFQFKLWVKGEDIEVEEVWRDNQFDWQSPNFMLLPRNNPKFRRLYESDSESCIDMMFVDEPPALFADLQGPPWYCLGRCAHPGIINSR